MKNGAARYPMYEDNGRCSIYVGNHSETDFEGSPCNYIAPPGSIPKHPHGCVVFKVLNDYL